MLIFFVYFKLILQSNIVNLVVVGSILPLPFAIRKAHNFRQHAKTTINSIIKKNPHT